MDLAALIIEQLDADGSLKRLTIRREPGQELTVAFPDEFKGDRSGPFFFPDAHDEETFKKGFANCRVLKQSASSFTSVNGVYYQQAHRGGIPIEQGRQSYYALSLPEYAIPSKVTVRDPRSKSLLSKYVIRDNDRNRFVIYVECRSTYGPFDFLLEVTFTIDRRYGIFGHAEYTDAQVSRYGGELLSYKTAMSPEQIEAVSRFFATAPNQQEDITSIKSHNEPLLFEMHPVNEHLTGDLRKWARCAKVIEEMKRIKAMYKRDGLTATEIEERYKDFEVWAIVRNRLDEEQQKQFRSPGAWTPTTLHYALSLLSKEYPNAPSTIYDWVKDYRRYSKAKR